MFLYHTLPHVRNGNLKTEQPLTLESLAGVSASDIWAVGSASTFGSPQTLAEHWDGTAWSIGASPSLGVSSLAAVGGRPAGPLFAVGARPGSTYTTLILQH